MFSKFQLSSFLELYEEIIASRSEEHAMHEASVARQGMGGEMLWKGQGKAAPRPK